MAGIRALKKEVETLLSQEDILQALSRIRMLPPERVLKPLFSCLCSNNDRIKWHAVSALGEIVRDIADSNFENARIVMRRFMWMLNDESGGIGWGVPEAIGEVTACHHQLAVEYAHILVSFMREDGFYLELETLQRGLMWGIGRLAQANPQILIDRQAEKYLLPYLQSTDTLVRALSFLAAGRLRAPSTVELLQKNISDHQEVNLYIDREFVSLPIGTIASQALEQIST